MSQAVLKNNGEVSICRTLCHMNIDNVNSKCEKINGKIFFNEIKCACGEYMSIPEGLYEEEYHIKLFALE